MSEQPSDYEPMSKEEADAPIEALQRIKCNFDKRFFTVDSLEIIDGLFNTVFVGLETRTAPKINVEGLKDEVCQAVVTDKEPYNALLVISGVHECIDYLIKHGIFQGIDNRKSLHVSELSDEEFEAIKNSQIPRELVPGEFLIIKDKIKITNKYIGPDPACKKCNGTGWWAYDDCHSQVCNMCCKHDKGWWLLPEGYTNAGKWGCRIGCGKTHKDMPIYDKCFVQCEDCYGLIIYGKECNCEEKYDT